MELGGRDVRAGSKAGRRTRTPSPTLLERTKEPGDLDEVLSKLDGFNTIFMSEFARRKKHVWVRR